MKTGPQPSISIFRSPGQAADDQRTTLAGQVAAGAGAALALLGPFSDVVSGIGVALLIVGVIVSAPAGRFPGPVMAEWWSVLGVAALVVLCGFGLGFWLSGLGGVVLTAGAISALAAVFFGTPARPAYRDKL